MKATRLVVYVLTIMLFHAIFYSLMYINGSFGRYSKPTQPHPSPVSVEEKVKQVVLFKTHMTGSSTLGGILFRFGAQHGLKFVNSARYYNFSDSNSPTLTVGDISLHHHIPTNIEEMMKQYERVVPNARFLSILREPVDRYLAQYDALAQKYAQDSFEGYMSQEQYNNGMSRDFGIFNRIDLDNFMIDGYAKFFYVIAERFDESMLLLKNEFGWNLQDILYVSLNQKCHSEGNPLSYDDTPTSCRPLRENYTKSQKKQMKSNNELDMDLYTWAAEDLQKKLNAQPQQFWDELALYKKMLLGLKDACLPSKEKECEPFLMNDFQYESQIGSDGVVSSYPIINIDV